jgi:hypothetical protein
MLNGSRLAERVKHFQVGPTVGKEPYTLIENPVNSARAISVLGRGIWESTT